MEGKTMPEVFGPGDTVLLTLNCGLIGARKTDFRALRGRCHFARRNRGLKLRLYREKYFVRRVSRKNIPVVLTEIALSKLSRRG